MSQASAIAAKRASRALAGLCTECDEPTFGKHSLCRRHHEERQARLKAWNDRRRRSRACYCGQPAKRGRDRCEACLAIENDRQKRRYRVRKQQRRCVMCRRGRTAKGRALCPRCCALRRSEYREMLERRLRKQLAVSRRGQLWHLLATGDCGT